MTNLTKYLPLLLLLAFVPSHAHALTGTQLYSLCVEQPKGGIADASCLAYLRGFIDGIIMGSTSQEVRQFCPPKDGVSADQTRLIAEKYLKDHPEKLHSEAGLIVALALAIAFPCPSN